MSKFKTIIPVDSAAVKKLLPPGHHLNRVIYNPDDSQVEVHWEHDAFQTPFTFETEFSIVNLEQQKVPQGVKLRKPAQKETNKTESTEPVVTEPEEPPTVPTAKKKTAAKPKAGK